MASNRTGKMIVAGLLSLVLAFAVLAPCAQAADKRDNKGEIERIDEAVRVLKEMSKEADKGVPGSLLRDCYGIAIFPDVIKAAFVIGGRLGKGIMIVRSGSGWSAPCFIRIRGGSAGWQIGVQSADLVLVFKTKRSVENFAKGKFTLGADVGVAVGPQGRQLEASTDAALKAEILSYSKSRGLFIGLSVQGASLHVDGKANTDFYGREITSGEIFAGKAAGDKAAIGRLRDGIADFIRASK